MTLQFFVKRTSTAVILASVAIGPAVVFTVIAFNYTSIIITGATSNYINTGITAAKTKAYQMSCQKV